MSKKPNGRPYTDVENLVSASVDQAVDEKLSPAIMRLDAATKKLDDITPLLKGICNRQMGQAIWMYGLTVCVLVIAVLMIQYLA